MLKFYNVRTLKKADLYYVSYNSDVDIKVSDLVIINVDNTQRLARVIQVLDKEPKIKNICKIAKKANKYDLKRQRENNKEAKKVLEFAKIKADELKLNMKFVDSEYTLTKSKIILYFTSNDRVDFRELVKLLVAHTKVRVELRQIGPRDEFRLFPTIGPCGREICCANHLSKFSSVTIKDAKEQGLQINMSKISGLCGKLKCCIKYEQDAYKDNGKLLPKYNQEVIVKETKEKGKVTGIDILNLKVRVKIINDKDEIKYETFNHTDLDYKLRR